MPGDGRQGHSLFGKIGAAFVQKKPSGARGEWLGKQAKSLQEQQGSQKMFFHTLKIAKLS